VTEQQWLACTDPMPMLEFLRTSGKLTDRKARLFAVACCRQVWTSLPDEAARTAVEVAERFADGLASRRELARAWSGTGWTVDVARTSSWYATRAGWRRVAWNAACNTSDAMADYHARSSRMTAPATSDSANPAVEVLRRYADFSAGRKRARAHQAEMLRDLIGPLPFRPVAVTQSWLTWNGDIVVRLAEAAYQNRRMPAGDLDGAALAVLADASEEAGCGDEAILRHLRGAGPHLRGCWAVDLLTGRA
jgi:hypothetical protein